MMPIVSYVVFQWAILQGPNPDVPVSHGSMVALEEDGARAIGPIESRARAPLAEVTEVPAILLAELDAQRFRLVGILVVEALERRAVGLTIADIIILVDRLAIPDQG